MTKQTSKTSKTKTKAKSSKAAKSGKAAAKSGARGGVLQPVATYVYFALLAAALILPYVPGLESLAGGVQHLLVAVILGAMLYSYVKGGQSKFTLIGAVLLALAGLALAPGGIF